MHYLFLVPFIPLILVVDLFVLIVRLLIAIGDALWGQPAPRTPRRRVLARQDRLHCAGCGRSTTPLERLCFGSLPECRTCRRNRLAVLRAVARR